MRVRMTVNNLKKLQSLLTKTVNLLEELEGNIEQINKFELDVEMDLEKIASKVSEKITESMEEMTNE
ncbi:hypothetical protein A0U40_18285 [[Bacillus] sp. KCTC 13219]|nr:hypothetical protein A0U40_18285 [[Bacillus] sp. KCTC 13219]